MPLRLIFMGTPEFAVPTLRALRDAGHEIAAVYTREARPAGRGILFAGGQWRALEDQQVELAIVVEVQKRQARSDNFRIVEVAGPAVEVLEANAACLRCVDECLLCRRRRDATCWRLVRCACRDGGR